MRKRFVTILITAVLAAALASCGSASNQPAGASENQITENTANAKEEAKAESAVAALDSKVESTASEAAKTESSTSVKTESAIKPELTESTKSEDKKSDDASKQTKPEETASDGNAAKKPSSKEESLGDYNPNDVKVTFERDFTNDNESAHISATYNGKELWNITTGAYPVSQLYCVSDLGKNGKRYYYVEKGSIVCVDLATGNELWRNSEFWGSPAEKAYGFGSDGTLYISGYLGPDLFVCKSDGTTVKNIGSFREDYYWPYELTCDEGSNRVKLVYEMSPYGDPGVLFVSLSDYTAREEKNSDANSGSKKETSDDGPIYYPDVENYLSLRSGPSTDSSRKEKIYPGTALIVLGYENGMAKVRVKDTGETGYVNPDYIKPEGSSSSSKSSSSSSSSGNSGSSGSKTSYDSDLRPGMTAYANVKEFLSLREGPSTSSDVITRLPDWTEFTILDYPEGKMVHVRVEETGETGYVHIDFLSY